MLQHKEDGHSVEHGIRTSRPHKFLGKPFRVASDTQRPCNTNGAAHGSTHACGGAGGRAREGGGGVTPEMRRRRGLGERCAQAACTFTDKFKLRPTCVLEGGERGAAVGRRHGSAEQRPGGTGSTTEGGGGKGESVQHFSLGFCGLLRAHHARFLGVAAGAHSGGGSGRCHDMAEMHMGHGHLAAASG